MPKVRREKVAATRSLRFASLVGILLPLKNNVDVFLGWQLSFWNIRCNFVPYHFQTDYSAKHSISVLLFSKIYKILNLIRTTLSALLMPLPATQVWPRMTLAVGFLALDFMQVLKQFPYLVVADRSIY